MTGFPLTGLAALLCGYVMSQFYRAFLAVLTPSLSADIGMSNNEMSQALAAWFIAFGFAQFVVGPMLDSIGPRKTAGLLHGLLAGGGTALFALATAPWMVIVAMALIGIGCSPVLMAPLFIFRKTFSASRLAVLTSTFIALGSIGNLLGTSPVAYLVDLWGWRPVIWLLCALSLLSAAAILLLVPKTERSGAQNHLQGSYLDLFKIRELWPIFPVLALTFSGVANIRGLWAGPYFEEIYGLGPIQIGNITLMMAVAMIVGTLIYGPLDTFFNSRKWVIAVGTGLLTTTLFPFAFYPEMGVTAASGLLIAMGLFGVAYAVVMAHGMAFVPDHLTGRGATLLNFFTIGGTGFVQSISGFTYDAAYDASDPISGYQAVFWLYALITLAALLYYLTSRDVKPNHSDGN